MTVMSEIGKEYGTALFMVACEVGEKKMYADALERVKRVFEEQPEYEQFLSSPSIPLKERMDAVEQAFGASVPEHVLCYLLLLCEKGRMDCFLRSVEEYNALYDASEHISDVRVTSAVALTDAEKQKLERKLTTVLGGEINALYAVDESLLGGLMVEADGKIMDGSLRRRLHEVKDVMNI